MIFISTAFAQYNERAILTQAAQQMMMQRNFTQAEQAWLQILVKYPDDINSVAQLFQIYLHINQTEKAEKLILDYRSLLPDNLRQEYDIQLTIQQAKLELAWDKAMAYIQLYPGDEYRYRTLASYFERKGYFEQSIELYEKGRKTLGKNDIFAMEIGNTAFNYRLYEKAIIEYLGFLEKQPGNIFFVNNQIKTIMQERPELISQLKSMAAKSGSNEVKEVYASALNKVGRYQEALNQYELLPPEKLLLFANEQYAAGKDSVAVLAYHAVVNKFTDVQNQGEILIRMADLHTRMKNFAAATEILATLTDNAPVTTPNIPVKGLITNKFQRTKYNMQAYIMQSELALWQEKSIDEIISLLQNAYKVANQPEDRADIQYRIINTYYIFEQMKDVETELAKIRSGNPTEKFRYYSYLLATDRQQVGLADTLMNDLIIATPSSKYVNDLMTMNILLMNLKGKAIQDFQVAWRLKLRHKDQMAVNQMYELSVSSKDEELRMLAADWALQAGLRMAADSLYTFEWKDELNKEYAVYMRSRLQTDPGAAEKTAQDFLKDNPSSVFSPGFRQILQKAPTGRPTL